MVSITRDEPPGGAVVTVNAGEAVGHRRQIEEVARIDGATRARVIEGALAKLDKSYVFPEIAKQAGDSLRARPERGAYDRYTSGQG